jgi:hypothetical protein
MREAGVDAWVVLLRENANDPLALHVGGENAGAPSAVLVFRVAGAGANGDDRVRSVMLAGFGEAIALRELALHDSVVVYDGGVAGLERAIAERLAAADPARIAVNSGGAGWPTGSRGRSARGSSGPSARRSPRASCPPSRWCARGSP